VTLEVLGLTAFVEWAVGVAIAAVAAAVAVYEALRKRRDRATRIGVSLNPVGRWLEFTAQMKRGRPVTLHHVGVCLRDGKRRYRLHHVVSGDTLPRTVGAHDKVVLATDGNELWRGLRDYGVQDVELRFYFEDGAGVPYDSPWAVANAASQTITPRPRGSFARLFGG
jgi:hypothetical protein